MPKVEPSTIDQIGGILESYASRGLFRGFSRGSVRAGRAAFKMLWHRDRFFELIVDSKRKTLRFPVVLPSVSADSSMYAEFKEFVASRQSDELPEHRRISIEKAIVRAGNKGGEVSLTMTLADDDFDYGVRRLIHLVHEIYMVFLYDARYYDYLIDTFDLD